MTTFLRHLEADIRVKPVHVSLYLSFWLEWIANQCENPITISRAKIMKASKIRSNATYHKHLRDLQKWGHIRYLPSYHPGKRSRIFFTPEKI